MQTEDTEGNGRVALVYCPETFLAPPLGLAYLKSALGRDNAECFDVNMDFQKKYNPDYRNNFRQHAYFQEYDIHVDEQLSHFNNVLCKDAIRSYGGFFAEWAERLSSFDIVGFSVTSSNVIATTVLAEMLKTNNPDIAIIAGGPAVFNSYRLYSNDMLERNIFDICVIGTGEDVVNEIVHSLRTQSKPLSSIPGLFFSGSSSIDSQKIIYSEGSKVRLSDFFYPPDFSDFDLADYLLDPNTLTIYTATGCVGNCTFCLLSRFYSKFNRKSIGAVKKEVLFLREEHGAHYTHFKCNDSLCFITNKKDAMDFFSFAIENDITFEFLIRLMPFWVDEEVIAALAKSGCSVNIGIESASPEVRRDMGKLVKQDFYDRFFELGAEYQIEMKINLMVGYPTETEDDFLLTFDLIKWVFSNTSNANIWVSPFNMTYEVIEEHNIEYDPDGTWSTPAVNIQDKIHRVSRILDWTYRSGFMSKLSHQYMRTTEGCHVPSLLDFDELNKNVGSIRLLPILPSRGNVDNVRVFGNMIVIDGWVVDMEHDHIPEFVVLCREDDREILSVSNVGNVVRPDVAEALDKEHYVNSGWSLTYLADDLSEIESTLSIFAISGCELIDFGFSKLNLLDCPLSQAK